MMLREMDTGGREGKEREAESRSMHQDGLLGETREELFMVNLHINDTFLPLMIPLLNAGNITCWELIRTVGKAAFVSLQRAYI